MEGGGADTLSDEELVALVRRATELVMELEGEVGCEGGGKEVDGGEGEEGEGDERGKEAGIGGEGKEGTVEAEGSGAGTVDGAASSSKAVCGDARRAAALIQLSDLTQRRQRCVELW